MSIKPVTNELRNKVIEKFQSLLQGLHLNSSAEVIENQCFEKCENNSDNYVKICQNFITNRARQIELLQNRAPTAQNFRPSMTSTSNNGTPSDPINALQNLTVTAGQPNQITMQQSNPQQQMSIRMNNNMFNAQIRQRGMMPVTLQSGNMQRTMEQFPMSQSPTTQVLQPQMQQVHTISSLNMVNANNIRLITKNVNTPNPTMQTYQLEGNNGAQVMSNIAQHTVSRPQLARMVTSSPLLLNNPGQQIPAQQLVQQEQPSSVKPNPSTPTNGTQPDECSSQSTSSSQISVPMSTNVPNTANSTVTQNPNTAPVKVSVSEEEATKVREELSRMSERYLKYIKLVLKNPEYIAGEQTMKVWVTLAGVLEDPKALNKNLSLKHVTKIQDFCEKAEKLVQLHNLEKSKPIALPKSEELFGKRVISDRNRTAVVATDVSTVNLDVTGTANNVNNSLDVAFDDVIHQLKKKDVCMMRKIQKNLVKFVKNSRPYCLHYLPRNLQFQDEDSSDNDGGKMDTNFDEHEFDYMDNIVIEGLIKRPPKGKNRAFDEHGMLRTDIDTNLSLSSEFSGVQCEMELVRGEFLVQQMGDQDRSSKWCTKDDTWEKSSFFSITYLNEKLPSQIPAIWLRVPADYELSGCLDWNLNLESYALLVRPDDSSSFLEDVRGAIEFEFGDLAGRSHWSGVNLLKALSVYKRSIQTGFSNYECRRATS